MSGAAAAGACMPKSMATVRPEARRITMKPPPPTPLIQGSTTPEQKAAATAASTALPPRCSISSAAAVAAGCLAAAAPRRPKAWRLRTIQPGLKDIDTVNRLPHWPAATFISVRMRSNAATASPTSTSTSALRRASTGG